MSVVLHTFDGGTVNAIDDARFYSYLTGGQSGVAEGVRITSAGGLTLHIAGGWGVILGRLFTVQAQYIEVTPSVSGTQKGRLILQIDMSDSDQPARVISQAARSLPQLVQEDINADGLIYQLPLAEYSVTEVALSDLKNTTPVLQSIAISTYTQSGNVLSGSGANGKFKATAGGTYTAFTIGGESYAVKEGSESEIELTIGVWYSFILDETQKTVNFKGGGGLSNSNLALATAEVSDVRDGKTFYSGDKELKTGTAPVFETLENNCLYDVANNINKGTWQNDYNNGMIISNTSNGLSFKNNISYSVAFTTNNIPIDVTKYNTMFVDIVTNGYVSNTVSDFIGLAYPGSIHNHENGNGTTPARVFADYISYAKKTNITLSIDISDLSGLMFVRLSKHNYNSELKDVVISKIYFT